MVGRDEPDAWQERRANATIGDQRTCAVGNRDSETQDESGKFSMQNYCYEEYASQLYAMQEKKGQAHGRSASGRENNLLCCNTPNVALHKPG